MPCFQENDIVCTRGCVRSPVVLSLSFLVVIAGVRRVCVAQTPAGPDHPWRTADPVVTAINRGVALMEQYEYTQAAEAFEQAVKLAPKLTEARFNLAIALFNRCAKGDVEAAEKLLDKVVQEAPDNLRALYTRGIVHMYAGQDEQALPCFEKVLESAPHESHAWYLLARSKEHLGRPCRAELNRAIQENPALVSAYYHLMRVALQEGKREEAKGYKEQFNRLRASPLAETVVMPQYQEMGPLAVVRPMSPTPGATVASGELGAGPARTLLEGSKELILAGPGGESQIDVAEGILSKHGVGLAMADVNDDGHPDIATTAALMDAQRGVALLLGEADGDYADATAKSGLAAVRNAVSCSFGDFDNDARIDLFVCCAGSNHLFKGRGDGTFEDVTAATATGGPGNVSSVSAVFLDADHDADLDIYVCNAAGANQLLNNNADGTFTDIAAGAGVACEDRRSIMLAPADIDGDRDTDLVVFNEDGPARLFLNDRVGKYHQEQITDEPIHAHAGGVLQDFNGDGRPDLLRAPGPDTPGGLLLSGATGKLKPASQFDGAIKALTTWGRVVTTRIADIDLDGDLDIVVFSKAGHILLNDGWGRFVLKAGVWPMPAEDEIIGVELADLTGDAVADVVQVAAADGGRIKFVPTTLTPPANWLAVTPTGDRGADKRTRSPASGFGTRMELHCGLHDQVMVYTGLNGGLSQSRMPFTFGLNGATKADYIFLLWPDGVTQSEITLTAGSHHTIREMERKISSCPVLFAWNGKRFAFVTDFAGVGGLGYFLAPGEYAPPQVLEHVKIEPEQLAARNGLYELRLCEPMEEVGYLDRIELLAVDHPGDLHVYPDERLAITGPPPTHRLLCPQRTIFPARAVAPDGKDCTDHLARVDRMYAYQPKLDRRFMGFSEPHTLVLDFEDRLAGLDARQDVYLFINGWIEYPYSQTTYAASQARVTWQPMKIELLTAGGRWETIVPDAGAPGGMGRMITVDLTGKLPAADGSIPAGRCKLRISTNLEIYYDQIFIAADRGTRDLAIRSVPIKQAVLRRLGFPLEYSPDGRHPLIYTYDIIEPTSPFKLARGTYTRYGRVDNLLAEFDDRYVILGSGDEVAVSFDARALPPPRDGEVRSFILVSHAYCKDMDLYTAECDTVEPLPFRSMSRYPYPPSENYPDAAQFRRYQREFNTRLVN